jgi:hypothetical protein
MMVARGCQSQCAAGLSGDFCTARVIVAGVDGLLAKASEGGDVMVKPPGFGRPGMWTSSH